MKIFDILSEISSKLTKAEIENPYLEATSLLSLVCKFEQAKIIAEPDKKISKAQQEKIEKLCQLRIEGWPLAYLSKKKSFYNLDFIVSPDTLIPRPESELIIEAVLSDVLNSHRKKNIIDIGTGSACLIISLTDILKNKSDFNFHGIDISPKALKIAKKNAKKHGLEKIIKFNLGDLLQPLIKKIKESKQKQDYFILANLPYLTKEEIKKSPSLKMEPKISLDGGKDGLVLYKKLFQQISEIKKDNNFNIYAEINPWQEKKILELIKKAFVKCSIKTEILLDLKKKSRLIIIKI